MAAQIRCAAGGAHQLEYCANRFGASSGAAGSVGRIATNTVNTGSMRPARRVRSGD